MNCTRAIGCAMFWWLLTCAASAGCATLDFDGAEYTATTAETLTAAWAASVQIVDGAEQACSDCEYELRIYHVERKTYSDGGKTTALKQTFKLPKSGHYVIEVRGCRGTGADRICSDWATSINEANTPQVNGALKKWRIYGRPAATGPIVVE